MKWWMVAAAILLLILICVLATDGIAWAGGAAVVIFGGHGAEQEPIRGGAQRTKSEARVIQQLEILTGLDFPTAHPKWMRGLELDGYNKEAKIALEFSGPLHTKWYPKVESYERYLKRVRTDRLKYHLCEEHGVYLIVVDQSLPQKHYVAYLRSRLFDAGYFDAKGADYIPVQKKRAWLRSPDDLAD